MTFRIARDRSGPYFGHIREYPGIISQARTSEGVRRKLLALLREIRRAHPQDLVRFR